MQGLAGALRRLQGHAEGAVAAADGAAQQAAVGAAHLHRRAGLGAAAEHGACAIDGEVGGGGGRGDVRGVDGAGFGDITGGVGQVDGQRLAVGLGRVQRQVETAIAANGAAADQIASDIAHVDRGAGLAAAAQAQAIG